MRWNSKYEGLRAVSIKMNDDSHLNFIANHSMNNKSTCRLMDEKYVAKHAKSLWSEYNQNMWDMLINTIGYYMKIIPKLKVTIH